MAFISGQAIFGLFEHHQNTYSVDQSPVRLPRVPGNDELKPHEYVPINASYQIRLIELLPPRKVSAGRNSIETLNCKIHSVTLREAPIYEALSYTWGKLNRHLPITLIHTGEQAVEDQALFATPQLVMALKRMRFPSTPRLLWIDQLCIDQGNEDEKGLQLQLMGEIYRRAQQVVVWLGEDPLVHDAYIGQTSFKEADVDLLEGMIKAFKEDSCQTRANDLKLAGELVDVRRTHHMISLEQRRLTAILELLNRPWFRRAWVFQEASFAQELLIQYGPLEVRLEDLKRVFDAVSALESVVGVQNRTSLAKDTGGFEMIRLINDARQRLMGPQSAVSSGINGSEFLSTLFSVLRRVEASDPRDLIFAFLAFQGNEGITATAESYRQMQEEVWKHAAECIIKASQSLDIFAAVSGDTSRPLQLSSWVPYWSDCFPYSRPIATPASRFAASRGQPHTWRETEDRNKLHVRGKIVDHIDAFMLGGYGKFASFKHSTHQFLGWDLLCLHTRRYLETKRDALGDGLAVKIDLLERDLMRTVLADGTMGEEQPLRCVYEMLDANKTAEKAWGLRNAGKEKLKEEEEEMLQDYEKLEVLSLVAELKQVFMTDGIQLGLAPLAAKIGDHIAIIHGSNVPCVLREVNGRFGEYRVISQCYLDGWMYGETPNDHTHPHSKWWEEKVDEFVLV